MYNWLVLNRTAISCRPVRFHSHYRNGRYSLGKISTFMRLLTLLDVVTAAPGEESRQMHFFHSFSPAVLCSGAFTRLAIYLTIAKAPRPKKTGISTSEIKSALKSAFFSLIPWSLDWFKQKEQQHATYSLRFKNS